MEIQGPVMKKSGSIKILKKFYKNSGWGAVCDQDKTTWGKLQGKQ